MFLRFNKGVENMDKFVVMCKFEGIDRYSCKSLYNLGYLEFSENEGMNVVCISDSLSEAKEELYHYINKYGENSVWCNWFEVSLKNF